MGGIKPVRAVYAALLVLMLTACGAAPAATLMPASELITTDEFEGIIFSAQRAEQIDPPTYRSGEVSGYWTPSQADVLGLEERLEPFLEHMVSQTGPDVLPRLPAYKRQYVGVQADDRRVIFANFFCNTHGIDWQRDWVEIADGGACYFEVSYDIATGEFFGLSVNGEA
jgi:hypothetical protein